VVSLQIIPTTLKQANELVRRLHRHHGPTVAHRWSIGVAMDGKMVGAAICGRPKARNLPQYSLLEVNRVVTDGTPNACSKLYGTCAKIAALMGFEEIETTILCTEPGTSLKAAGWKFRRIVRAEGWDRPSRKRAKQPIIEKQVFGKRLR
jgi:hypothetical protein